MATKFVHQKRFSVPWKQYMKLGHINTNLTYLTETRPLNFETYKSYLSVPIIAIMTLPSIAPAWKIKRSSGHSLDHKSSFFKYVFVATRARTWSHTNAVFYLTSLKAWGIPKIPAPMNEIKMLAKILMELLAPSSWYILRQMTFNVLKL